MDDHFKQIYAQRAEQYDVLVQREDYAGNLLPALAALHPLQGVTVAEFGAGTGRVTRLLLPLVRYIYAFDNAPAMLHVAHDTLSRARPVPGVGHWSLAAGDNRRMPLPQGCVDLALAGWSFGHFVGWHPSDWQAQVGAAVDEMLRVLKPGGTALIIETLGTGTEDPAPPNEGLAAYYAWLERERGFRQTWVRTDYLFNSLDEAETLTRFFFGDALADRVRRENLVALPECTGIWWRDEL